ncbi:MAG: hypothetical protein AAF988_01275 [Pseudomonadota bacterium]
MRNDFTGVTAKDMEDTKSGAWAETGGDKLAMLPANLQQQVMALRS